VDNKHNLVVATHTINRNDLNALGAIVLKQKKICSYFYRLVDSYHNGREIAQCLSNNITTIVAHPARNKQRKRHATDYLVANQYNKLTIPIHVPKEKL
jgi:hypothetical protein